MILSTFLLIAIVYIFLYAKITKDNNTYTPEDIYQGTITSISKSHTVTVPHGFYSKTKEVKPTVTIKNNAGFYIKFTIEDSLDEDLSIGDYFDYSDYV